MFAYQNYHRHHHGLWPIQSIKFLYHQYPQQSKAQGHDRRISVQNSKIDETVSAASTGHWECRCLRAKGQVKEMCLQMFLEGSNWNGWIDRQRHVVPERWGTRVKGSSTCVGLDPRDRRTDSFAWFQWTGWKWCGKHGVKINRLLFMKHFVGQQTDLEQYSKFYWQPMKWTKQWNTASKRR